MLFVCDLGITARTPPADLVHCHPHGSAAGTQPLYADAGRPCTTAAYIALASMRPRSPCRSKKLKAVPASGAVRQLAAGPVVRSTGPPACLPTAPLAGTALSFFDLHVLRGRILASAM